MEHSNIWRSTPVMSSNTTMLAWSMAVDLADAAPEGVIGTNNDGHEPFRHFGAF
jgi:hypothetical protein